MPATENVSLPDRYRVTRRIASGGMATVYACEDQVLGRLVAVKVLAPAFAQDSDAVARFQREARAVARVSDHPHVVTIYDIGEHEDSAFIVMEYFSGGTVADRMRSGEPIPRPTVVRWLREAASALDHAHPNEIVHRDVKPANLLLDAKGRLAVADFGIARMASDVGVTSTGMVLGTAAYLSPEQAQGSRATAASDRYALAVVAFELLTGRRPFGGEHPAAQARAHVESSPPAASAIDEELDTEVDHVIWRGLEKDPDQRWPTAAAMVDALDRALGEETEPEPVAVEPPTAPTRAATRREPAPAPTPEPTPTPAPAPRPRAAAAAPRPAPAAPAKRRSWGPVLIAALLIGLLAGGVIAAVIGGGGDEGKPASTTQAKRPSTQSQSSSQADTQPTEPAQTTTQPPATSTSSAPASASGNPSQLQAQGHSLIGQGNYDEAIPVLQKATKDCPVSRTDPCAYALYDLGVALRRAGRPEEAVPVLQQRLQNPDQKKTVKAELKKAQKGQTD